LMLLCPELNSDKKTKIVSITFIIILIPFETLCWWKLTQQT
jgi:hypothetical protein